MREPQSIKCTHPNNDTSVNGNVLWECGYTKNQSIDKDFWMFNKGKFSNIINDVTEVLGLRSWMHEVDKNQTSEAKFTGLNINGDVLGETTTGIHQVKDGKETNRMYNLQGMRMNSEDGKMPAGIYIINGKKVIILFSDFAPPKADFMSI